MPDTCRRPVRRRQARPRYARRGPHPVLLLAVLALAVGAGIAVATRGGGPGGSPVPAVADGTTGRAASRAATDAPTATPSVPPVTPSATAAPTATPPPTATRLPVARLRFVGDVMLARSIGERIERDGPETVFAAVTDDLAGADLTIANLECAISERGERANKYYTFRAPPEGAAAMADAGIDVVALANNHAVDFGRTALVDTLDHLDTAGIGVAGGGRDATEARAPEVATVNGLRIAFLSYAGQMVERSGWRTTDGEATADAAGIAIGRPEEVAADVAAARDVADVVVVLMHAGIEGSAEPAPVQRAIAEAAFGAGALLVIGHHPHVLQGTWHDDGRLVAWSLGNFVFDGFDGFYGDRANDSAILDVTVTSTGVDAFEWLPMRVVDGLPEPAGGAQAERISARLATVQAP